MPFTGKSLEAQTNELLGPGSLVDGWLIMSQTVRWENLISERLTSQGVGLFGAATRILAGRQAAQHELGVICGHNLTVHTSDHSYASAPEDGQCRPFE